MLEALGQSPFRLGVVVAPYRDVREHAQRHDVMRHLLKPLPYHGAGHFEPVVGESDARICELGRVARQVVVARVRGIAFKGLAGSKQLRGELPPAIFQPCIECDSAPQHCNGFGTAATGRIRATELQLYERRVGERARQRLEYRNCPRRITKLAARAREQQARLDLPGGGGEDVGGALRGRPRVGLEQQRCAHELEIDRGTRCQKRKLQERRGCWRHR